MTEIDWNLFHDSVLISILIEWELGKVTLKIKMNQKPSRSIDLVFSDFVELKCPRHFSWGRAVCINEISEHIIDDAFIMVRIEMQSGDVIETQAKRCWIG